MLKILSELRDSLRQKKFSSSMFPLFVFICGEQILDENEQIKPSDDLRREKNKRQFILDQIQNISSRMVVGVIAETLIATFKDSDSLTFEGILADISDEIVIIVESVGTFCELGAFSFSQDLIGKLYVLNDESHKEDKSFINRGPIRKINNARGAQSKYIVYDTDEWEKDAELKDHFELWKKRKVAFQVPKIDEETKVYQVNLKCFVYEVINIISIFQPVTKSEFLEIYKFLRGTFRINDSQNKVKQVSPIFEMLQKLRLIEKVDQYYFSNVENCCNNYMFDLTVGETEKIRVKILDEYLKNDPARIEVKKNHDDFGTDVS